MAQPDKVLEAKVQRAVCEFMDASPWYRGWWFHVPNERREKMHAVVLKREGVKKGVPDILCIRPSGDYVGLALELKRPGAPPSAVTAEQKAWLRSFRQMGWATAVARGVDEALDVLVGYSLGPVREKESENQPSHTP